MKLTTLSKLAVATAALTMASMSMAQNYKPEYRLSLVVGTAFPWGKGGEIWAEKVRERTNGRINIKLYPGVSLVQGDQTREFSALRQGVIDMAVGSTINWSPQVKELNVFSMPFLTTTYAGTDAIIKEIGPDLFKAIDERGVLPLAWGENGFRQLSNSKRPIGMPDDLKGMKIRIVGSPLFIDTFTALGANPTQMSWADAQPALASGAVDGQENPLSIFIASKMQTLGQKYITMWNYMNDPLVYAVNKDVWNSWTPEDREIVKQATIDTGKEQIALARKGLIEPGEPMIKQIIDSGVSVNYLTDPQLAAFKKAVSPVYEKWKKQIGPALIDRAERAVATSK